ncbi:MAG: nucleoside triphosphate pyrophosphohydrolase [Deltaproteobacteria bacterium]|nr:nucleoside triphosphate pyrophosphohydrolase [Deltaproteobacteria bacterium]
METTTTEKAFSRLIELIRTLRGEDGCPWDRVQTPASVVPYLLEEAFEVADAFERGDSEQSASELGDLFFQLIFLIEMEKEKGHFDYTTVLESITEKMIRRHPHVFGDEKISSVSEVAQNWHRIKQEEHKGRESDQLDSIPGNMPALMYAQRVGERASKAGFDWNDAQGVLDKAEEEWRELRESIGSNGMDHPSVREELGDLLFTLVNVCRFMKAPAELLLRYAVIKFLRRFKAVLQDIESSGKAARDVSPAELDQVWNAIKGAEKPGEERLQELQAQVERSVGYRFGRPELLRQALCHDSYANEHPQEFDQSNERLEFLGDSVLSLLISTKLFHRFPDAQEGDLSKMRAFLVNSQSLATASRSLGLDHFLLLGKGEESTGGRQKDSILADTMEAVLGAIYLDGGLAATEGIVERTIGEQIRSGELVTKTSDHKSRLQEISYALFKIHPQYELIGEEGPDHDKTFSVQALLDGKKLAEGKGRTKKDAAQQAAQTALKRIEAGWRP